MSKTVEYNVSIYSNYHEGFQIHFSKSSHSENECDHCLVIKYDDKSADKYIACICVVESGHDCATIVYQKSESNEDDAITIVIRAFAQIHDVLPFVTTGLSSGYTEEGYYPELSEKYKQHLPIDLNKYIDSDRMYGIVFSIDNQSILYNEPILPLM